MREIKLEVMFEYHNADFERVLGKHYTSVNRLISGEDKLPYADLDIICKRQFTGLKDKNEKDIYEGDIVKTTYPTFVSHYIEVVTYEKAFGFTPIQSPCDYDEAYLSPHDIEVIGNIYENQELLEQ